MTMTDKEIMDDAEREKARADSCEDHKFYPVELKYPQGDRPFPILVTACPNCGTFRQRIAHFEWSDAS